MLLAEGLLTSRWMAARRSYKTVISLIKLLYIRVWVLHASKLRFVFFFFFLIDVAINVVWAFLGIKEMIQFGCLDSC